MSERHWNPEPWPLCRVPAVRVGDETPVAEVLGGGWPSCCDDPGTSHIILTGELCHYTAPPIWASLEWLCGVADGLVIDLSALCFIDAAGIRLLIRLRDRLAERDRSLALDAPRPNVAWMLTLVGLADLVPAARHGRV